MTTKEWPADNYAIGSYIQATVAEPYLAHLDIKAGDAVLDLGCGNGAFSLKMVKQYPMASFLGIDASENMLALASKELAEYPHVSLQKADVEAMEFNNQFDWIVSFWCLQWVHDVKTAFANIYRALKSGGRLLLIFPTGDDPFMTTFKAVKESRQFAILDDFQPPVDYQKFKELEQTLRFLPFKSFQVERVSQSLLLPSLDVFRTFVNGIAFYHGQVPEEQIKDLNEAMVTAFAEQCRQRHSGKLHFDFTIFYLTGDK
ncbi:class I SAM-dependent methyltransferase [Legionella oakridgensis]|uniref:Methylase involved in ubiquinone/menaquinone biosynthesis n=2 Tax=Legionella oakridgensis TaxID=29423 RepID=W0BGH3_9GAMM|nr:class I SAM-dependent methyltransferase [Legionella oakridgensis]AHE67722.1 methylase involved in ubiquinone/menaquinone biosynthesis [Legionella oakridgensis ATCC 33761 = DSM 21215]ETO92714.1 methylase involved in ubiquinone/menaquinone biosynthesis [Legionella oakridgensis RV-2-2007]KTD36946.1 methyltransferase [Legionella oakridgensis]STY20745.1 methyltransferase [Legionella longbeachae]